MEILRIIGAGLFVVFFFGLCIFIHELGHFLVAKWRGLHIIAFSIGFKKVWGFTHDGIEYRIGCLPFGGYVDLPQIDSTGEPKTPDGKLLPPAKPLDRILTAVAGPISNVILGFALGCIVWFYGVPMDTPKMDKIVVDEVPVECPEYQAGLRPGDIITKINGEPFNDTWNAVVRRILFTVGNIRLEVVRDGKKLPKDIVYTPIPHPKMMKREEINYPFFRPVLPFKVDPIPGSAAATAGFKDGDQILAINGEKLGNQYPLTLVQKFCEQGAKDLTVTVRRGIENLDIKHVKVKEADPVYRIGIKFAWQALPIKVTEVIPDSPAAVAGIKAGDTIKEVAGNTLQHPIELVERINTTKDTPLKLLVTRDNKDIAVSLTPKMYRQYEFDGLLRHVDLAHPTPLTQFTNVVSWTYKSVRGIGYSVAKNVGLTEKTSSLKPKNLTGPIGIIVSMGQVAVKRGFVEALFFVVVITYSLALLNIMPFPVLDGGHVLFALIELVIGRPLPKKLIQPLTVACVVLLFSFVIYVTFYDVKKRLPDDPENQEIKKEAKDTADDESKAAIDQPETPEQNEKAGDDEEAEKKPTD